jgi:hypothetical protein
VFSNIAQVFTTTFTKVRHWTLSSATRKQLKLSQIISVISILILSSHLCLSLLKRIAPFGVFDEHFVCVSQFPTRVTRHCWLKYPWLYQVRITNIELPMTLGYKIPTADSIKTTVFYKMMSCNFIDRYRRFGETSPSSTLKPKLILYETSQNFKCRSPTSFITG